MRARPTALSPCKKKAFFFPLFVTLKCQLVYVAVGNLKRAGYQLALGWYPGPVQLLPAHVGASAGSLQGGYTPSAPRMPGLAAWAGETGRGGEGAPRAAECVATSLKRMKICHSSPRQVCVVRGTQPQEQLPGAPGKWGGRGSRACFACQGGVLYSCN